MATVRKHHRNGVVITVNRDYPQDPPKSYIWHKSSEIDRFLDGNKFTKYGYEIDGKRQNLYRAENSFARKTGITKYGEIFDDLEEVADFVIDVFSTAWWQRRYSKTRLHIKDGRRAKKAMAWYSGKMTLPRRLRSPFIVLHELIHFTVPKPHPGHGRLFCARLKEIVGWNWSDEAEGVLADCYRQNNVKWHPHHNVPEKYE